MKLSTFCWPLLPLQDYSRRRFPRFICHRGHPPLRGAQGRELILTLRLVACRGPLTLRKRRPGATTRLPSSTGVPRCCPLLLNHLTSVHVRTYRKASESPAGTLCPWTPSLSPLHGHIETFYGSDSIQTSVAFGSPVPSLQAVTNFPAPPCPMPQPRGAASEPRTAASVRREVAPRAAAVGDCPDTFDEVQHHHFYPQKSVCTSGAPPPPPVGVSPALVHNILDNPLSAVFCNSCGFILTNHFNCVACWGIYSRLGCHLAQWSEH